MGLGQSRLNPPSRVGATREDQTKKEDLVVFLDMDNTLIFTEILDDHDGKEAEGENVLISTLESDGEGRKITVYKRPHLDFFLQQVSTRFVQVNIFTAASKDYADCILNRLDPMGTIFTKRWYRDSCTGPQNDLRKDVLSLDIKVDPKRFVLVDDNGFHMLNNPCNGIVVARFDKERLDENDNDVLLQVLRLLNTLAGHKDVRPCLEKPVHNNYKISVCSSRMDNLLLFVHPDHFLYNFGNQDDARRLRHEICSHADWMTLSSSPHPTKLSL